MEREMKSNKMVAIILGLMHSINFTFAISILSLNSCVSKSSNISHNVEEAYVAEESKAAKKDALEVAKLYLTSYLKAQAGNGFFEERYQFYTSSEFPPDVIFSSESERWYISFSNGGTGCTVCVELNECLSKGTVTNSTNRIIGGEMLVPINDAPPLFDLKTFTILAKDYFRSW
jgi:hypothetical protein